MNVNELRKNCCILLMIRRNKNKLLKYPGGEIISKGLNDIRHKKYDSIEALAVFTASPRLNDFGFRIDEDFFVYPHLLLYKKLQKKFSDNAHSQYNAVMSRVAKFCNHY